MALFTSKEKKDCRTCGQNVFFHIAYGWKHTRLLYESGFHAVQLDDSERCAVCGWALALAQGGIGCRRGDCSMRPRPLTLWAPVRAKSEEELLQRTRTEFVCGFCFVPAREYDEGVQRVVLVVKKKPTWQQGRLNGVGGGMELGETPLQAMEREFKEETGVHCVGWQEFCQLGDARGYTVHFFSHRSSTPLAVATMGEEEIVTRTIDEVTIHNAIPNLTWLLPMAVSMTFERAAKFNIMEESKAAAAVPSL